MTSVYNQLTIAWNNLSIEFRRDVAEPTSTTTIAEFLDGLDSRANIWYEMARNQDRSRGGDWHTSKIPPRPNRPGQSRGKGGF